MLKKFKNYMVIHCPEREQAVDLIFWDGTEVPERNSKDEAMAGWDKYQDKTVYGLMWHPSYDKPTLVWYGAIDDPELIGEQITEYADLE